MSVGPPRLDLVGADALYQSDKIRWVIDLDRDLSEANLRYVIKRRRESADANALVDTSQSDMGTLELEATSDFNTDGSPKELVVITVENPAAATLVGRLVHELFDAPGSDGLAVLTEFHGDIEFVRRVTHDT